MALEKLLSTHPGLQEGVFIEDVPVLEVKGKIVEIGDPDQE
jgi:hypothetical protein